MFSHAFASTILVLASVSVAACGSNTMSSVSEAAAATAHPALVSHDAVLQNVKVKAANGGINPAAAAFDISGQVLLGSNSCFAAGASAKLVQEKKNGVISVKAVRQIAANSGSHVCPAVYMPVFASVQTTVRGDATLADKVEVRNVNALNVVIGLNDLLRKNEVVVTGVKAAAINGGINPMAYAYSLQATVEAGSNACMASNASISFVEKKIGTVLYIAAVKKTLMPGLMCTMEYAPVYKTISTEVHAMGGEVNNVVIKNVDAAGQDQDIQDFVTED